jgi:sporulation integral membrane protein YlbJ
MPRYLKLNPLLAAGLLLFAFIIMLLAYPKEGIQAAVRGILIWWDVLFPSLFPFLVVAELMLGFGVVHFFGSLLDPLMRPLFRVPGIGGFVMTMGFASGYPMAAKLTSQLWDQKLVTREEGERLVAFTTSSDPIFLIGAVSVGFFHDARIAIALGAAHYGTALLVGLLMRFHGKGRMSAPPVKQDGGRLLSRSFKAMHDARLKDGRPFGQMLREAVQSSIQLIFVIGGLVVFASAVLEVLSISGILQLCQEGAGRLLSSIGFPRELAYSIVDGAFEVTLGAKAAGGAAASIPLVYKAACGAFVLAWAGLSVHAQIISILHRTDLRYAPFILARLVHGLLSATAVVLLWDVLQPAAGAAQSVFSNFQEGQRPESIIRMWSIPSAGMSALILTLFLLLAASLFRFHIRMKKRFGK